MKRKEKFQCPHCGVKLPFLFVWKIKNDHEFECPNCGATLVPEKTKPFLWGYVVGFLAMTVPGQVLLYLYDDFLLAIAVGTVCSTTALVAFCLYLYTNTTMVRS